MQAEIVQPQLSQIDQLAIIRKYHHIAILTESKSTQARLAELKQTIEAEVAQNQEVQQPSPRVNRELRFVGQSRFVDKSILFIPEFSEPVEVALNQFDICINQGFAFYKVLQGNPSVLQYTSVIAMISSTPGDIRRVCDPHLLIIGRRVGRASVAIDLASGKNRSNPIFHSWLREKQEKFLGLDLPEAGHPLALELRVLGDLRVRDFSINFLGFKALKAQKDEKVKVEY